MTTMSPAESARRRKRADEEKRIKALMKARLKAGVSQADFLRELNEKMRSELVSVGNANDVHLLQNPREGKKLLVLDLDYTLFDYKSEGDVTQLRRPYLDDFLAGVYPHYDLCIWSQSSWTRLQTILLQLGLIDHADYKFTFILDATCMYKVTKVSKSGRVSVHEVKDLHYVWGKMPLSYNPCNTIMVDDLKVRRASAAPARPLAHSQPRPAAKLCVQPAQRPAHQAVQPEGAHGGRRQRPAAAPRPARLSAAHCRLLRLYIAQARPVARAGAAGRGERERELPLFRLSTTAKPRAVMPRRRQIRTRAVPRSTAARRGS